MYKRFLNLCLIFTTIFLCYSVNTFAVNAQIIEDQADKSIKELYHTLNAMPNTSMAHRIDWISAQFKGVPYLTHPLGEGPKARFDQHPRYRVDGFDCDTYVNTVLALALSNSLGSFQNNINQMRYKNGHVSYINRNHFTSIDWNKNNQERGILKDITETITDANEKPVAQRAIAIIDKPSWYHHKKLSTIHLYKSSKEERKSRLKELKLKGSQLEVTESNIPYLPLTALFHSNGKADDYLFSQIPDAAIIEIIRPNWDLRKEIGTALNVSHLGFAIWKQGKLYFREASSTEGKVTDVLMINYLKEALKSPTIKGINVQVVNKSLIIHPYKITQ